MTNRPLIKGVKLKKLKPIADERGTLMEVLRADDETFEKFGQVYITTAYPGVVKAWHKHEKQDDNIVVIKGMVKLVLWNGSCVVKKDIEVNEFFIGDKNPVLVHVPAGVWHGFKNIGVDECIVMNIPTEPYSMFNPDEQRMVPHDQSCPYDWSRKDG